MLTYQEGLNHVGKRNVRFATLYTIKTLFLTKTVAKHLKFKVGYLTVILRFINIMGIAVMIGLMIGSLH